MQRAVDGSVLAATPEGSVCSAVFAVCEAHDVAYTGLEGVKHRLVMNRTARMLLISMPLDPPSKDPSKRSSKAHQCIFVRDILLDNNNILCSTLTL